MKKLDKVLSIAVIMLMLVSVCTNVFAGSVLDQMNGKANLNGADTKIGTIGNTILTIITTVAMVLAVVLIAVLGIKYMMGSTEEKAEYKKSLIPYIVGAVLVFGAGAIGRMVVGWLKIFINVWRKEHEVIYDHKEY